MKEKRRKLCKPRKYLTAQVRIVQTSLLSDYIAKREPLSTELYRAYQVSEYLFSLVFQQFLTVL
jgi:hypothetical protein